MERVFVIVCALLVTARAGPISISTDSNTCSRACTDRGKFNYVAGKTYNYQYESDIKTLYHGASEDHAALHLSASVQLEILSKCEISMRLTDVSLTEYDPVDAMMKEVSSEFKAGLEKFPVRMSFQDGGIDDICLSGPEPIWVMNAKRGIISLIQNNMHDFATNRTVAETDVSGVCDTEYFVRETGWYKTSISKSKNLLGCTDRQGYNTAVQGVPYTAQSDIQSLPLLKSDHNCVHEIDKQAGFLKKVVCKEQHVFRPFSKSDSGAVTYNTQTLTFTRMTTGTKSPAPISTRVSLKFEHVHDVESEGWNRKDITRKLMEICEKTKSGVRPETPRLFTDLVYLMKSADVDTLSDINKMLTEGKICPDNLFRTRKYFLDALPMAGTSASVHMITELITSNVITGVEAEMWLTTLSFIKNPTKDMLKEVKPLINLPDSSEKALLSVGTMIHSYCFHHGGCETDDMVKAIISAFTNKMAKGCKVNVNNMKSTLMVLRGLGNAGYATNAIPKLSVCMRLQSNPVEIRLSAIEAFRRMPCGSERVALMSLLQDTEEDSEIRIAAYRVLMECPSDKVLGVVRNTLAREEVNQVGSYIWTHLTNLMETSDRHKQDIRAMLEDETFKKEFDMDKRKFSRNYEGSMFIERLNTGAKLEGDLIWSSKSFIPRSAMMNLTFDLFGHSVNLFELGGRAEGLEYFFESLFGPNGYFRNPEDDSSASDVVPKNIKGDKMKKIDKRFSAQMADLRGSLYMRVFGNELRYMNFKGMDSLLSGPDFNILDMLIKLSEDNDYTYTHSAMFLDSSYIVPTSSGFPLNLTVNGTATVDLRMKGKMDLRHPPSLNIAGLIQPSAAIDVSSMMSVDAFVTKSGIKMVSTLHTSTALQGKLSIDEKGSISTEYEMPEPRMEIIDVKSSFFTVHRDMEREQKMITENRQTLSYCSSEKIVTVTGLELCAEVAYPNASMKSAAPYFPMTGPVTAGIYLYNRDTHVKYKMEAKSIHNKDKNIIHLIFDTPNSRIDRHVEVDFSLNKRDLSLEATLISPWKKANIQGTITNSKKMAGISGKMNIDGKAPYSFDAQLGRDVRGNNYIFNPSLEIQSSAQSSGTVKGMFSLKNWKQLDVQIDSDLLTVQPVSAKLTINNKEALMGIQGSLDVAQNKQYSFDVNLATTAYKKKILFKPLLSVRSPTKELVAFGGGVTHVYGKGLDINLVLDKIVEKKITLTGKLNKAVKRRRSIYNTNMNFRSSPADFSIKAKFDKKSMGTIASDIDFTYVIRRVARNNIKLVSKIINLSTKSLTKAKANVNLEVKRNPELNLKLLSEISHNKKHTEIDGDFWYGTDFKNDDKHVEMRFEMNRNLKSLMEASADIQTRVRVPELDFAFMMKGAHSHDGRDLNSNFTFKFGKTQPFETSLQIHDKTEKLMKFDTEYQLSFPGCNLDIDHALEQTADNRYISTLKTQIKKGQQSVIKTTIIPNDRKVAISSDVKFYGQNPAKLQGEFGLEPTDFITSLSFETGSQKYAGSLSSATEIGKSSWLLLDIYHPARHMVLSLKGKNTNGMFSGDAELQLNTTQKIRVNAWFEEPRPEKLNGSITVSYPSRTFILNAYHAKGSKYSSHADFQWEPNKKITADTVFDITDDAVIGSAKMSSPFARLPKLDIEAKLSHDSEQYNADASVSLGDSNTVTLKSEIKKPISLQTLVSSVSVKSSRNSLMGIKSINIDVNHKLSSSLASSVRFGWNRQFVQTDVILQNTTKGKKMSFYGSVDLKTSYKYIKKGKLIFSHDNNGRTFSTDISANRNRKTYKMVSKMTHLPSEDRYDNTGSITISSSSGSVETTWNHRHSAVNVATSLTSAWGKNKNRMITGRFNSNFDDSFAATFELQTPFAVARDTKFQASYTRQNNLMDSSMALSVNGNKLGSAEVGYSVEEDKSAAGLAVVVPDLDVDTQFEAKASFIKAGTLSANVKAVITPDINMSIEGTTKVLKSGTLAHTIILWKSSLPGYEQVRYTYEVLADDDLATITKLEYGTGKQIQLETKFGLSPTYGHTSAVLTTPFESLPKMQGGISVRGNLESFKSDVFIEIQPYFEKTSAQLIWDTNSGLVSSLRVDLPIAEYPYFQADISGQFSKPSSEFDIKIEYMPKETIQLQMNHKLSGSDLTLSAKALSPFGTVSVHHIGKPDDFKCKLALQDSNMKNYGLDIGFTNAARTEGSITISSPGRRDISALFSHTGDVLNFNTHAEVQHNRKNSFTSDLSFTADTKIKLSLSGSLKTELISNTEEYETAFDFDGIPIKFSTHGEFSTSLGKSQADLYFDMTTSSEGNLIIRSPFMRNIKASFNHFRRDDYMQSAVDVIHGGKKIVDMEASLNRQDSVIGELKIKVPLLEDIAFMTRFDGEIESFVIRSEGSYGLKKADIDISSKLDSKLIQQKISVSAINMKDISAEFSYNGDLSHMKSYGELNIGQDRHRIDLIFSNTQNTEGSLSFESPLTDPVTVNLQHSGRLNDFKSRAELKLASDISAVDVSFSRNSADLSMNIDIKSPFIKDVMVSLSHTNKRSNLNTNGRLSIEGMDDFNVRYSSSMEPLTISLVITTPMENFTNFETSVSMTELSAESRSFHFDYIFNQKKSDIDAYYSNTDKFTGQLSIKSHLIPDSSVSFEHEGKLNNFKSHAEYTFGDKKSELDIFYSGLSRYEGLVTVNSHLTPYFSVGFEHNGKLNNFKSHGEYSIGFDKRETDISLNVENDIEIHIQYKCPVHGVSTAAFTHTGALADFKCHAEVTRSGEKWEGDLSFSSKSKIQGVIILKPSYSSQLAPLTLNFEHTGVPTNFRTRNEFILGNDKTTNEIAVILTDRTASSSFKLTSPYYKDISANLRSKGEPKNFKLHADLQFGTDQMDTDFSVQLTDSSIVSSFNLKSSMCENIAADFNINGKLTDFSSNANFKIGRNENTGTFSFTKVDKEIVSSLDIKSSYMNDMSMNLRHSGDVEKFTTEYDTTFDGEKRKALIDLNLKDNIIGKLSIDQPRFSVEGSVTEGVMRVSLTNNLDEYSAAFTYSLKDKITFDGRIITPYKGYKTLQASYEHTGDLRNFRCTGKFTIEQEESIFNIVSDTRDILNMDSSFDLSSPYTTPFDIKISSSVAEGKQIYNTEMNTSNRKMYGLLVSTLNSKSLKEMKVELYANGVRHNVLDMTSSSTGFTVSSEIIYDGDNNKIEMTFSNEPNIKLIGTVSVFLNSIYIRHFQANVDFEGSQTNIAGTSDLIWDGTKFGQVIFSLIMEDQIVGEFSLEAPEMPSLHNALKGEFSFFPGDNAFTMDTKMTTGSRKLIDFALNCDFKSKYDINFALESKEPHPLSAKFSFSNVQSILKMNLELIHDSVNLLNSNIDLTMKKVPIFVDGSATLNTRSTANSFSIHIDPDAKTYRSDASLKLDKDTWSFFVNFDAKSNVDAIFKVGIPSMEEIRGTLTHIQRTYRSKTNAEFRLNSTYKIEYDMEMKWRNGLDGSMSLKTPFEGFETTTLKTDYDGSFPNIKSSAEINLANKLIAASATISQTDTSKAEFTLTTPFEPLENLALSVYHDGGFSDFKTGGRLMYTTGEDIELDLEHSWIGITKESKARFMSPFTNEIIVSANHSGTAADFSSDYEVSIGSDLKYSSKTSLKYGSQFFMFKNLISVMMSGETDEQRIELKHDGSLEKFKTEALFQSLSYVYRIDTSFQLEPVMEGSLEVMTPFKKFRDVKASFRHTGSSNGMLSTGEIQFAPMKKISGKLDLMQYGWRRMVTHMELRTPFENMQVNKLSYKHFGDSDSFNCEMESEIVGKEVSATLAASRKPLSISLDIRTPFKGFETIGLSGNFLSKKKDQINSRMQAKWNPSSQIVIETSMTFSPPFDAEISVLTPFEPLRDASVTVSEKQLAKGYRESLKITHNSKSLIDVDLDHSLFLKHKHILATVRAPRSMKFELDGDFTLKFVDELDGDFTLIFVDFDLNANWNADDINSNVRLEAGYDVRAEKTISVKLTQSRLPGKILSLNGLLNGKYSKADLAWGMKPADKVGYEINVGDFDGKLKLILPTRSLLFAGSCRGRFTEGSFMWDADVDETKKVGFKSLVVTTRGVVKADINIMMPSLGKNVKVGSEILVNQGRVLFDGKTVLSYSGDSRKNLVFTSKLEDISAAGSKNYSFSVGVSHPYTTTGVTVNSHAGKSNTGYSAGVGLEYLTVKKQTKKFQISGSIDKLRKSVSFELQSPVKSVSISGRVQTDDKFQVSLLNVYDQRQPLHTQFTFDSATRSIDFTTNFDLDYPRNEFRINSKYVNSSAVATEVFHVVNGNKITDVLMTARLNNSHLLHSRLHWRPEMVKDLEAFVERKAMDYNRRLRAAAARIEPEIVEEVAQKFHKIWTAVAEEIGDENIARFEAAVVPWLDLGFQTTVAFSGPVLHKVNEILARSRGNFEKSVTTYKDFMNNRPIPQTATELSDTSMDYEALNFLRQTVTDNFNLVSDKIKLPSKHIPGYVTTLVNSAVEEMSASNIRALGVLLDAMESYLREELLEAEKGLEERLRSLEKIVMGHMKSPFTVYDPAHGEIQMELYSIIPLQSLDSLPVINFVKYIEKIRAMKNSLSNSIPEISLRDFSAELLPPFTGVATVTQGHKITTFDGFVYDLNNDCTFILTRDYTDGNFSLILSNDGYTTLTVLTTGKPISINIQGEILVSGEPAALPFTEGYVTVTQNEGGIVTIKGGNHFSIDYDLTVDHMAIQISGWYHGKTGGLLGVYDNEPSNDKMTSFNKVVANTSRFAKTWDVGTSSCR